MIEIINGSCVDQEVDAIVNAANRYLLSGGGVCGEIYKRAGYSELNDACSKIDTPLNDGDAVITNSFNIKNANYIIHAVGPDFSKTPNAFKELYDAYYNSLELLKSNNLHSISFSLISSGIYGIGLDNPVEESTKQCLNAYNDFINKYKDYNINVKLYAYSNNEYMKVRDYYDIYNR